MGVKSHLLFSLGCHCKQAGDERNLPQTVSFFDAAHLPFPDHVPDLIALQGSPRRFERKEASPRFDASFDEAVILFDQIVEIFDADVNSQLSGKIPSALRSSMALG